jgi:hypothetical protein
VIRNAYWATFYLLIFRAGTIAGIMLIPFVIAVPIIYSANGFRTCSRYVAAAAGVLSLTFRFFLVDQIGFVDGLFR